MEKKLTLAWTCFPSSKSFGRSLARKKHLASHAMEVESSLLTPCPEKEKDKGKGEEVGPSRKRRHGVGVSSAANSPSTLVRAPELWNPELTVKELRRRVTHDDMAQDFETSLAVAHAMMIPRDVAKLQNEDELTTCSLTVM